MNCGDRVNVTQLDDGTLIITVNGFSYSVNPGSRVSCDPSGLGIMIDGVLCAFPRNGGGGSGDNVVTGLSLDDENNTLTLTQSDGPAISVDLTPLAEEGWTPPEGDEGQVLGFDENGNIVAIDLPEPPADEDHYVESATFDDETRILTLTRTDPLDPLTVEIPSEFQFPETGTPFFLLQRGAAGGVLTEGRLFLGTLSVTSAYPDDAIVPAVPGGADETAPFGRLRATADPVRITLAKRGDTGTLKAADAVEPDDLVTLSQLNDATEPPADEDHYVESATFDDETRTLTLTRTDPLDPLTVEIPSDATELPEGVEGQVVGYGEDGQPVAMDLPEPDPIPSGTVEDILSWDNSGAPMVAPRNFITPQMYGAQGDGVTDDLAAFVLMATRAFALKAAMYVKGGTYRLSQGFTVFHPTTLIGAAGAELLFDDMEGGDGITISLPDIPGPAGKYNTTEISGFKVRIRGSDGGSFIRTPRGTPRQGTNILNGSAPRYIFRDMQINGAQSPIISHVSQVFWECVFDIGESNAAEVSGIVSNGSYDYTAEPTPANTRSNFIRLSADEEQVRGALRSPIIRDCVVMNFGRVVDVRKRISRLQMSHFYAHNCWEGFIADIPRESSDYGSDENEFTSINFNVQKTGFHIVGTSNGSAFRGVDVTRATGGYDHGQDWHGFFVDNIYRAHFDGCAVRTNYANGEYAGTSYGVRARTVLALSAASFYQRGMGPGGGLDHLFYVETPRRVSLVGVQSHGTINNIVTLTGSVRPETLITLSNVGQADAGQLRGQRLLLEGDVTPSQVDDLDFDGVQGLLVATQDETTREFKHPTFTELTGRSPATVSYGGTVPVYANNTGAPAAPRVYTTQPIAETLAYRNAAGQLLAARATDAGHLVNLGQATEVTGVTIDAGNLTHTLNPMDLTNTLFVGLDGSLTSDDEVFIGIDPTGTRAGNFVEVRLAGFEGPNAPTVTIGTTDETDTEPLAVRSRTVTKNTPGTDLYTLRGLIISDGGTPRFRVLSEHRIHLSGVPTLPPVANAGNVSAARRLTQAEYDALPEIDEDTIYYIVGAP